MSQVQVTRQRTKVKNSSENAGMSAGKTHLQDVDTDEEAPTWAKSLTNAFRSNQKSLNAKLEEINSAIQNLSREFKAVKHRIANAEKRISDLEDD